MSHTWLTANEVAGHAGLTRRAISKAFAKAVVTGEGWRGSSLAIRRVPGRGGASGSLFQVRLDTLPAEIQLRWKELQTAFEGRSAHGPKAQAERDWWYGVLTPALATPKHSSERGLTLREIAGRRHMRPDGRWETVSERTLQRKLDAFERTGSVAVLGRTKRADAGERKVVVSARWDKAVAFNYETKQTIARDLLQYVRGLIVKGEHGAMLGTLASKRLADLTLSFGHTDDLDRVCVVPEGLLRREKQYRTVARHDRDRKAYEDIDRPRIQRSRDGMMPMDVVIGDVHPLDIMCRRADGSTVHPKAIAWMDGATNRLWFDIVFLPPHQGIRNEDVIASFVRMTRAWGLATRLYLDNGSEYNWAAFIDDALQLMSRTNKPGFGIGYCDERQSGIIRARPYNAAAKPIEGAFGLLERLHLSAIEGWIGGDRMRKKTSHVGRAPDPFPGTFEELAGQVLASVELYHNQPQTRGKSLGGRSPYGALKAAIAAGWTMTSVDDAAFAGAFSVRQERRLTQGTFEHANKSWRCDELQECLDDRVVALIPKYEREVTHILVERLDGTTLGIATPAQKFAFTDPAGAREAERLGRMKTKAVRNARKSVPDLNRMGERMGLLETYTPAAVPPTSGRVSAAPGPARLHEAQQKSPKQQQDDAYQARLRKHEEDGARVDALHRLLTGK